MRKSKNFVLDGVIFYLKLSGDVVITYADGSPFSYSFFESPEEAEKAFEIEEQKYQLDIIDYKTRIDTPLS